MICGIYGVDCSTMLPVLDRLQNIELHMYEWYDKLPLLA
jgi:hypothetical protein